MNNYEKIHLIEQIVHPYFNFEMDDFYGDVLPYPKIEDLDIFYFKRNKDIVITKYEEEIILNAIAKLNIGSVDFIKIPSLGIYIYINMKQTKLNMIVVAYFNYDTQRSDIEKFMNKDDAKKWLYDRWGFLLDDETSLPTTLEGLIYLLYNEHGVIVERIEI